MNITQLKAAVDLAFDRGINPDTAVVVDGSDHCFDWLIVDRVSDPTIDDDGYIWFTLHLSTEEADGRFTPCHYGKE